MQHQHAYTAIQTVVQSLQAQIKDTYIASYLYGSLVTGQFEPDTSDINMLVVVQDEVDIHQVRSGLRGTWETVGALFKQTPGIAPLTLFQQFMQLNPMFARHLITQGKQVKGGAAPIQALPEPQAEERLAWSAQELLEASAALAAELMDVPADREAAERHFARLVRRSDEKAGGGGTAVGHFIQLHTQVDFGSTDVSLPPETDAAPYAIPGLCAVYQKRDMLLLVLNEISALAQIDWSALKQQAESNFFNGIQFATPAQLCLAVEYHGALDLKLRSFQHQWGADPLATLSPTFESILRDAARYPAQLAIFDFPHLLTILDDDDLGKFIHDFQNKLLNIRLENELLARFEVCPKFEAPEPLPDRATPHPERISAIYQRFRDWVSFYLDQQAALAEQPGSGS